MKFHHFFIKSGKENKKRRTPSNIKLFVVRHGIFFKPISKLYFSQSGIVTAADTSSPPDLFNVFLFNCKRTLISQRTPIIYPFLTKVKHLFVRFLNFLKIFQPFMSILIYYTNTLKTCSLICNIPFAVGCPQSLSISFRATYCIP